MTFCRQADGKGTIHITSHWSLTPEQAAWKGKEECLENWDWEDRPDDVVCIGVIRCHDCTVVRWEDDHPDGVTCEPPKPVKKKVPKGEEVVTIPFVKDGKPASIRGSKNMIEKLVTTLEKNDPKLKRNDQDQNDT